MTDWNNPSTSQTHTNELAATKGRDESNATMDYSSDSNIPDGTIRWNTSSQRFEIWDATNSVWNELISKYLINVDQLDGLDAGNASGDVPINNGTLNTDLDADTLDGLHAIALLFRANNLSDLDSASTARSNLGLGSAAVRSIGFAASDVIEVQTGPKYGFNDLTLERYSQTIEEETAGFTLASADNGKTKHCNFSSADNVTVPADSTLALPIGFTVTLVALGGGDVTVNPASGVTVNSKDGNLVIDGQYAAATLYKYATDTWNLVGALTA